MKWAADEGGRGVGVAGRVESTREVGEEAGKEEGES